jgi:hypothetical protein
MLSATATNSGSVRDSRASSLGGGLRRKAVVGQLAEVNEMLWERQAE